MLSQTQARQSNSSLFGFVVHRLVHRSVGVGRNLLAELAEWQDSQSSNPGSIPGSATKPRSHSSGRLYTPPLTRGSLDQV